MTVNQPFMPVSNSVEDPGSVLLKVSTGHQTTKRCSIENRAYETDHINQLLSLLSGARNPVRTRAVVYPRVAGRHTLLLEGMPAESAYVLVSAKPFRMNRKAGAIWRAQAWRPINIIHC